MSRLGQAETRIRALVDNRHRAQVKIAVGRKLKILKAERDIVDVSLKTYDDKIKSLEAWLERYDK